MAFSIDFRLLGPPVDINQAFQQGMQTGRATRMQRTRDNALQALAHDPMNVNALTGLKSVDPEMGHRFEQNALASQQLQQRRQFGQQYASGDRTGARTAAIGAGNFELANQFASLDKATQESIRGKYQIAAPILMQAKGLPYEQRAAAIAAVKPYLLSGGWTEQEIVGFDPTDQALDGQISAAMTVEQLIERDKPIAVADGTELISRDGRLIARNEPQTKWVPVGEGGLVAIGPDGQPVGTPQYVPGAPAGNSAPSAPQGPFTVNGVPGDTETSRTRTPERNREVGGVSNSFHLSGRASDRRPPKGMSMAAYHAELVRRNPGMDVINEGDHVHIEPRGRASGAPRRVSSQQEFAALASGTEFIAPDGSVRRKP